MSASITLTREQVKEIITEYSNYDVTKPLTQYNALRHIINQMVLWYTETDITTPKFHLKIDRSVITHIKTLVCDQWKQKIDLYYKNDLVPGTRVYSVPSYGLEFWKGQFVDLIGTVVDIKSIKTHDDNTVYILLEGKVGRTLNQYDVVSINSAAVRVNNKDYKVGDLVED